MKSAKPMVLLVEDDPTTLSVFERVLAREGTLKVATARDGAEGWERARVLRPDVIVSDYEMPQLTGFDLCKRIKADEATKDAMFLMLTAHGDTALKVQGLGLGVDDYLIKPIESAELIARVRAMLRIKSLIDRTRADQAVLAKLHERLEHSFEHLLTLLVHMLDLRVPGAAQRGRRLAVVARALAKRLEIPDRFLQDLEMAARVHEIGRVGESRELAVPNEDAGPVAVGGGGWTYLLDSAAILRQVDRLEPVAELVLYVGEHWDGTGLPGHRRSGQIPLRSRVLRVLIDFFAELESGGAPRMPREALARISRHAGTWYDPAVVAQLAAMVGEIPVPTGSTERHQVAVGTLEPGMVLADDLMTSSGVKLLARGAVITEAMRQIIVRRHLIDPIVGGVWIN